MPPNQAERAVGKWEVLLQCGHPSVAEVATFSTATSVNGWLGMSGNCAINNDRRLGGSSDDNNPSVTDRTDGLWAKLLPRHDQVDLLRSIATADLQLIMEACRRPDRRPGRVVGGEPTSFATP